MSLWWQAYLDNPSFLLAWVFWVVLSICLHELGHGWMAIRCGDMTPQWSGHMTWNPFVHIPLPGWIMFVLVGITWGLMPVDPSRMRRTYHEALVALAGPAMNLLLGVVCVIAGGIALSQAPMSLVPSDKSPMALLLQFCLIGGALNAVLLVFNLLPVPPLDGSRVVATFIRSYREFAYSPQGQIVGLLVLAGLFVLGPMGLFNPVIAVVTDLIVWVASLLGSGRSP